MICKNCNKEFDKGFGNFCSRSCAVSFGNKKKIRTKETNKKISQGLQKHLENTPRKIYFCKICGRPHFYREKCTNDFCNRYNSVIFNKLIKYCGFDKSKLGTIEVEQEFNRVREMLYDLYWNQHKSSSEICKLLNIPKSIYTSIHFIFHYLGIPSKNLKYAQQENIFENRFKVASNPLYKQQWHTTWNDKEVFVRSNNELKYAQELDEQKIDYEVEGLRIKYWDSQIQEYRCAIPDFYIPDENMIVEIKSGWTLDKQNMIDKKKAYIENGYKFKCICDFVEIDI